MSGERISRRKLSAHIADRIVSGAPFDDVIKQTAAYLIETKQTRDVDLLVRSIEDALMHRGVVVADIASAHPLTSEVKAEIAAFLGATELQARETVDPELLGGVRVDIPGKRYDATLRRKINALKTVER